MKHRYENLLRDDVAFAARASDLRSQLDIIEENALALAELAAAGLPTTLRQAIIHTRYQLCAMLKRPALRIVLFSKFSRRQEDADRWVRWQVQGALTRAEGRRAVDRHKRKAEVDAVRLAAWNASSDHVDTHGLQQARSPDRPFHHAPQDEETSR